METTLSRDTLIIGGTGTLGTALLETMDPSKVIIFSRDELKQHELMHKYPSLKCVLGDIRIKASIEKAMDCLYGNKRVFHVAALKHVDVLEANPEEAYRTNILGTVNSAEVAKKNNVQDFYFTSTDKAVLPINVYGMTKAISERYLLNQNDKKPFSTRFKVFRWGNILGSRGSVVALFAKSLLRDSAVYVTDKRMTRFWLKIEDAVKYMLEFGGDYTKVNFPDMKAASVLDVACAVAEVLGIKDFKVKDIGIRPGEKLHECMYTSHEECLRSDTAPSFSHNELVDLVKPIVETL
tara:strand:+ start:3117 stop:3998 length:882 start_codon:yes stop_codon:yes gene_type:complete